MVVIVLERVPIGVRGELSRWMLELHTGVFVGNLSAMVRDKLWEHVCSKLRDGAGLLVHKTDNEQGFAIRYAGKTNRTIEDYDGLTLVRLPS